MAGSSIITSLTILFSLITVAGVLAVLYHFRRLPVTALIQGAEKRAAFHRNAATALESAIAAERAAGKDTALLETSLASHHRALRSLAAAEPFAPRR